MPQKQLMTHKPKTDHKPVFHPSVVEEKKRKDAGDKRPSPPTPALIQRAAQAPQSITPPEAGQMQRAFGNQMLKRLTIQTKLTLGPVGDKYEQEADAIAKQVVGRLSHHEPPAAQRQEEEDELQMSPISTLQRQEDEDDELQMKPAAMLDGGGIPADIESQIQSAKGGGRPLPPQTQSSMSRAFNADFSGIKIHTDAQSDQLNRAIRARAFTTGQDIFFRQGEYNPHSSGGQELLAHELTHTIQQTGGGQAQRQPAVQRLVMTRDFMNNAGIPRKKKKGEMRKLLDALDA